MNTKKTTRVGFVAQPCPRNRLEMRTGLHLVREIVPLCLANLADKAQKGSSQLENNRKEVVAL